jgi:Asp-tRNA(Asn)/Glu-tRNA(Gln) amidotransferase A subunit family amidase
VLAERRLPAAPVSRVAAFEEDGLQPVSDACRMAVRKTVATLTETGVEVVDEQPPGAADLRAAFDTILNQELLIALGPRLEAREVDVMPYIAELAEAARAFVPSFTAYLAAWQRVAEIDLTAAAWFARNPVVGVQLIGRRGEERTLIALAQRLEETLGGWLDPDKPRT